MLASFSRFCHLNSLNTVFQYAKYLRLCLIVALLGYRGFLCLFSYDPCCAKHPVLSRYTAWMAPPRWLRRIMVFYCPKKFTTMSFDTPANCWLTQLGCLFTKFVPFFTKFVHFFPLNFIIHCYPASLAPCLTPQYYYHQTKPGFRCTEFKKDQYQNIASGAVSCTLHLF